MGFVEIFGFCLSIFGMYGVVIYFQYLLPCYIVPSISELLSNSQQILAHAVEINSFPETSEYRMDLEITALRVNSHGCEWRAIAPQASSSNFGLQFGMVSHAGFIPSLREFMQSVVLQLAIDEQRIATSQGLAGAAFPGPAADTAISTGFIAEPTPPPAAAIS
ncbi:hypothetical protein B0F90DRAFT_1816532 [Multifurca ochricompacta]|uniref:Uncharacterized protein n=1 Tax=Multifurca ochricompacta TaxID=376703 RepID=A0AAD4QPA5_9AGAM|nr:hypothetical protein B0F90DRAFT_1816532 [Multifurca ochricompacta]